MPRPKQTFEASVVSSDLKYWGYYKGRQCSADGYPAGATIREILAGTVPRPGHRILVKDMTPKAWDINARVMRLPSELVAALIGRYCLPIKDNGQPYSLSEIASAIGIDVGTLKGRLNEARARYRSMIFGVVLPKNMGYIQKNGRRNAQ